MKILNLPNASVLVTILMALSSAGCGSSATDSGNTTIYLFPTATTTLAADNSTLTRSAVNSACTNAGPPTACKHKTAAFISFSSSDQISSFATQLSLPGGKVVGPTGTVIADSWSALLQGTIKASPVAAGAFPSSVGYAYYPTASNVNGSYNSTLDCAGWTSPSGSVGVGDPSQSNSDMVRGASASCNIPVTLLCVCY